MSDSENPEYVLGHSERELDRLIKQAAFFGDLTAHTLRLAGLRPACASWISAAAPATSHSSPPPSSAPPARWWAPTRTPTR